jgi:hypothetical protein
MPETNKMHYYNICSYFMVSDGVFLTEHCGQIGDAQGQDVEEDGFGHPHLGQPEQRSHNEEDPGVCEQSQQIAGQIGEGDELAEALRHFKGNGELGSANALTDPKWHQQFDAGEVWLQLQFRLAAAKQMQVVAGRR